MQTDFERHWRSRFERYASMRDDDAGIAGWSTTGLAARVRHFERNWRPAAGSRFWADVGCGAGTYTRLLATRGVKVIGADYSAPTLAKAMVRGGAIAWLQSDVTRLPFRDGALDGILCFGVTQALSSSETALSEMARSTAAGGQVWIDALNRWCLPHLAARLWRRLRGRGYHLRYESPWKMQRFAIALGLTDVRLLWLPILPGSMQRWQWIVETRWFIALMHAFPPFGAAVSHSFVLAARKKDLPR